MTRRSTYRPRRRISYREHVAAALGVVVGMLALALFVIALHVS